MLRFPSLVHFTRFKNSLLRTITAEINEHIESDNFSCRMRRYPVKHSILKVNVKQNAYKNWYAPNESFNTRKSKQNNCMHSFCSKILEIVYKKEEAPSIRVFCSFINKMLSEKVWPKDFMDKSMQGKTFSWTWKNKKEWVDFTLTDMTKPSGIFEVWQNYCLSKNKHD